MRARTDLLMIAALCLVLQPHRTSAQALIIRNSQTPKFGVCSPRLVEDLRLGAEFSPEEQAFGTIMSFSFGENGDIYIVDSRAPAVRVFSETGKYIRSIGRKGRGPGEFESPYRIWVGASRVTIYDLALGRIVNFDLSGKPINTALVPFNSSAPPFLASGTINGDLYLAQAPAENFRTKGPVIHRFAPNLDLRASFARVDIPDSVDWRYLATGPLAVDRNGRVWFAPLADLLLERFSMTGSSDLRVTRNHDFKFRPRPFRTAVPGPRGSTRIGFDNNRAAVTSLAIDDNDRLWLFIRDVPGKRIVADVYDTNGVYERRYEFPLTGPSRIDANGRFYRVFSEGGYPELVRYESVSPSGRSTC